MYIYKYKYIHTVDIYLYIYIYIFVCQFVIDCATWTVAGGYVRATFHVSLF